MLNLKEFAEKLSAFISLVAFKFLNVKQIVLFSSSLTI